MSGPPAGPPQGLPDRIGFQPDRPGPAAFTPYISAATAHRELTPLPIIVGTVLGLIFGASSLYLVAGLNEAITSLGDNNPLRDGPISDLLSLIPFLFLIAVLYLTGREKLLAPRNRGPG